MNATRKEPNRTKSHATLLRQSEEDKAALHALAEHHGISMADLVTMLIRREIRREGIIPKPLNHYTL